MFISASKTLRFSFGFLSPEPHLKRFVMECAMIYAWMLQLSGQRKIPACGAWRQW